MQNNAFFSVTVLTIGIFLCSPSFAQHGPSAVPFDWQAEWGSILPDTGIPAGQFNVKKDIKHAVETCGTGDTDYSKIRTFKADFNNDGLSDYISGAAGYFDTTSQTCPVPMCSEPHGCNISIYLHEATTQIITAAPIPPAACPQNASDNIHCLAYCPARKNICPSLFQGNTRLPLEPAPENPAACPVSAADNTQCLSYCAATRENCPALFRYTSKLIWNKPVRGWSVIPASTYAHIAATHLMTDGVTRKYRPPFNQASVLVTTLPRSSCTLEEMDVNNNGYITSGEPCIKYYQYYNGRFRDMYNPQASTLSIDGENDNRYTTVAFSRTDAKIDSETLGQSQWRKAAENKGINNLKLEAHKQFITQIANFTLQEQAQIIGKKGKLEQKPLTKNIELICHEYHNKSDKSYFIPTKTDYEIQSFESAITGGSMEGVTINECTRQYTPWSGTLSCPTLNCGETVTIAAQRFCQRSSSAYAACGECDGKADTQPFYSDSNNKCFFSDTCSGGECNGGGGDDCLPAGAKILMADGSEKLIEQVLAGDKVMGFDKDAPLGVLKPVKVLQKLETDRQTLIMINDMKISANHMLPYNNGNSLSAGSLTVGDDLVGVSGQKVKIERIEPVTDETAVYNISLDGADGYIVDGIRVNAHSRL